MSTRKALSEVLNIPFLGKVMLIMLFFPPLLLLWVIAKVPSNEKEVRTLGIVTAVEGDEKLARKVHYEFESEGIKYKGRMQFVNLREHPEIKEGAQVPIYYLPSTPLLSRAEHETPTRQMFWILFAVCAALWIWVLWKARGIKKTYELSNMPR